MTYVIYGLLFNGFSLLYLIIKQKMYIVFIACLVLEVNSQMWRKVDCLTIAHVTFSAQQPMTAFNTYNIQVPWPDPLSDISNAVLALKGFSFSPANSYLSFEANLTITPTGTIIAFQPNLADTTVNLIQFQVLGVSTCADGKIWLLSQTFVPTELIKPVVNFQNATNQYFQNRVVVNTSIFLVPVRQWQNFTIVVPFDISPVQEFSVSTYFQDFTVNVPNGQRQDLSIQRIFVSRQNISISVMSQPLFNNTISRITFSLLIVKRIALQTVMAHYNQSLYWTNSINSNNCSQPQCSKNITLNISLLNPSTIPAQQCVIGIFDLLIDSNLADSSNQRSVVRKNGSSVQLATQNLNWVQYNLSCYLSCPPGYYLFKSTNISSCEPDCPMGCASCSNPTTCLSCSQGFTLINSSCIACDQGCSLCSSIGSCSNCEQKYFLQETKCFKCSQGCLQCTDSSTCLKCQDLYLLRKQQCFWTLPIIIAVPIVFVAIIIALLIFCCSKTGYNCRKAVRKSCCGNQVIIRYRNVQEEKKQKLLAIVQKDQSEITVDFRGRNEDCSVCTFPQIFIKTVCNHFFHCICIKQWINRNNNCPNCKRQNINQIEIYCYKCNKYLQRWNLLDTSIDFMNIYRVICNKCDLSEQQQKV